MININKSIQIIELEPVFPDQRRFSATLQFSSEAHITSFLLATDDDDDKTLEEHIKNDLRRRLAHYIAESFYGDLKTKLISLLHSIMCETYMSDELRDRFENIINHVGKLQLQEEE